MIVSVINGIDNGPYLRYSPGKYILCNLRISMAHPFPPDNHFMFAAFAAAFLLKLLRGKFAPLVTEEQRRNIEPLVEQLVQTLDHVAADETHTPKAYARFLASLLDKHRMASMAAAATDAEDITTKPRLSSMPESTGAGGGGAGMLGLGGRDVSQVPLYSEHDGILASSISPTGPAPGQSDYDMGGLQLSHVHHVGSVDTSSSGGSGTLGLSAPGSRNMMGLDPFPPHFSSTCTSNSTTLYSNNEHSRSSFDFHHKDEDYGSQYPGMSSLQDSAFWDNGLVPWPVSGLPGGFNELSPTTAYGLHYQSQASA